MTSRNIYSIYDNRVMGFSSYRNWIFFIEKGGKTRGLCPRSATSPPARVCCSIKSRNGAREENKVELKVHICIGPNCNSSWSSRQGLCSCTVPLLGQVVISFQGGAPRLVTWQMRDSIQYDITTEGQRGGAVGGCSESKAYLSLEIDAVIFLARRWIIHTSISISLRSNYR